MAKSKRSKRQSNSRRQKTHAAMAADNRSVENNGQSVPAVNGKKAGKGWKARARAMHVGGNS